MRWIVERKQTIKPNWSKTGCSLPVLLVAVGNSEAFGNFVLVIAHPVLCIWRTRLSLHICPRLQALSCYLCRKIFYILRYQIFRLHFLRSFDLSPASLPSVVSCLIGLPKYYLAKHTVYKVLGAQYSVISLNILSSALHIFLSPPF
jgi:hypothetical protein